MKSPQTILLQCHRQLVLLTKIFGSFDIILNWISTFQHNLIQTIYLKMMIWNNTTYINLFWIYFLAFVDLSISVMVKWLMHIFSIISDWFFKICITVIDERLPRIYHFMTRSVDNRAKHNLINCHPCYK